MIKTAIIIIVTLAVGGLTGYLIKSSNPDDSILRVYANEFGRPNTLEPLVSQRVIVKDPAIKSKAYPYVYVPGEESLSHDELRIVVLGSGNTMATHQQKAASFLVETGNGEVFIFDAGVGSFANFNELLIPVHKANKIFLTHLHFDHMLDIGGYFHMGIVANRLGPLHIYGAAGPDSTLGISRWVEAFREIAGWTVEGKKCCFDIRNMEIQAHEFEPDRERLIYDGNNVKVFAYPVPHVMRGAVGYRLEYLGLSFSYGGDSQASMQTVKNSQGVDVLIHEVVNTPEFFSETMGIPDKMAKKIVWTKHTPPEAAGKVFDLSQPKLAVAYHMFLLDDTPGRIAHGIRKEFQGPLMIAQDLSVINVSAAQIVVRMATRREQRPVPDIDLWHIIKNRPKPDPANAKFDEEDWLQESVITLDFIEEFKRNEGIEAQ